MITKNKRFFIYILFILFLADVSDVNAAGNRIQTGADQTARYIPMLKDKKVGLVANQTSVIHSKLLVDSLLAMGINVVKIFSPEHGFRGSADAGKTVNNSVDAITGIPVVSLFGRKYKPTGDDLQGVDVMLYDMQDLGVRFYTYISTLYYVMQACAENVIPLIILDRPDPNGFYIDGPVLDLKYKSFVGMLQIPIVYGMTAGELAKMINGQKWLGTGLNCKLTIIPCENYTHSTFYALPVNPSPNITSMEAVYLYPSIGLFEGTKMNVGRGTSFPFRVVGNPDYPVQDFSYVPVAGISNKNPMHKGLRCYGIDLRGISTDSLQKTARINLNWLITTYSLMPKDSFFNDYFNYLAGNSQLIQQIRDGWSEEKIRKSWDEDLEKFKKIRAKYLIYPE